MNKNNPNEEDIIELLGRIQPFPTPGFKTSLDKQPWKIKKPFSFISWMTPIKVVIAFCFVLILFIGVNLLSPTLTTFAQRFSNFFYPSIQTPVNGTFDILETRHPLERFTLTIDEAEKLAGFKLNTFSRGPLGFKLIGATFDDFRDAIILHYTNETGGLVLRVSQQEIDPDFQSVGPDATVELVFIGPYKGEYVAGGWMIPEVESGADASIDPSKLATATWNASLNLQTLRWSDGKYLYELILAGDQDQFGYLNRDGLIDLANRMH